MRKNPDLASLRAMYRRAPTLIEHQRVTCEALGFRWLTDHHRRALVRVLREELVRTTGSSFSDFRDVGSTTID